MSKNLELKKVNKSFVPEPISCILGFPMYISHIRILVVFLDLYILQQQWDYLNHSSWDIWVHISLKGISPKVNVKAQLEFELAYFETAVQHFNYYITVTHPPINKYTANNFVFVINQKYQYFIISSGTLNNKSGYY